MADPFKELLDELRDRGLEDDDVQRLESALAASPIRKERDAAVAERDKYRDVALKAAFKDVGIKVDPKLLNPALFADLDVTDADKVREWAVASNLVDPPEPSPEDLQREADLAADQRTSGIAATGTVKANGVIRPTDTQGWDRNKIARFRKQHPDAHAQLMRGETVSGIVFN